MKTSNYNLQFNKLCKQLNLGEIIGSPEVLSGGLLHRMYAVHTSQGTFAIKALNPQIMNRKEAKQNFIYSEEIANIAADSLPAAAAKKLNGSFLHEIDGQFYLVFDWRDGRRLQLSEVHDLHCEKIGSLLADIHLIDFSEVDMDKNHIDNLPIIDWNEYLHKGQRSGSEWVELLHECVENLYEWTAAANHATQQLATHQVISHRDLDVKNVLWSMDNPTIIDWESAGYTNPNHDLVETAVYWSENEAGCIEIERFMAFLDGYRRKKGALHADWRLVLLQGFSGKLGWLEYNLRRSLWIECVDEQEQQLGTEQVMSTIQSIRRYAEMIPTLEAWLEM